MYLLVPVRAFNVCAQSSSTKLRLSLLFLPSLLFPFHSSPDISYYHGPWRRTQGGLSRAVGCHYESRQGGAIARGQRQAHARKSSPPSGIEPRLTIASLHSSDHSQLNSSPKSLPRSTSSLSRPAFEFLNNSFTLPARGSIQTSRWTRCKTTKP
jgi:hypothetical protein